MCTPFPNSNDINQRCQVIIKETNRNPRANYNTMISERSFFHLNDTPMFPINNIDTSTKMRTDMLARRSNPRYCVKL